MVAFVRLLFYFRVSTASFIGEWSPEVAVLAEGRDLDLDSRETSLRGQQAAARCNTFRLLTLCVCSRFATQFHGLSVLLLIHRRLKPSSKTSCVIFVPWSRSRLIYYSYEVSWLIDGVQWMYDRRLHFLFIASFTVTFYQFFRKYLAIIQTTVSLLKRGHRTWHIVYDHLKLGFLGKYISYSSQRLVGKVILHRKRLTEISRYTLCVL